jgi:hypothetical protein
MVASHQMLTDPRGSYLAVEEHVVIVIHLAAGTGS